MSFSKEPPADSKSESMKNDFIWNKGVCNLDLVQDVVGSHIEPHIAFTMGGFQDLIAGEAVIYPDWVVDSPASDETANVPQTGFTPSEDLVSAPCDNQESSPATKDGTEECVETYTYLMSQQVSSPTKMTRRIIEEAQIATVAGVEILGDGEWVADKDYQSMRDEDHPIEQEDQKKPSQEETKSTVDSIVLELISHVWNGAEPQNYHANISLDWHPKEFPVQIDSGSSLLWLQAKLDVTEKHPLDQEVFDPIISRNHPRNDLNSPRYTYTYGSGKVYCYLYQEDFLLGGCKATDQVFGAAPISQNGYFVRQNVVGILGLGFPSEQTTQHDNLVVNLHRQGRIKFPSFSMVGPRNDPKLAAEIDRRQIMQPRGQAILGAVCPCYFTGEIAWSAVLDSEPKRWSVNLEEVRVNGKVVLRDQQALIDTGTAYIVTSAPNFKTVRESLKGTPVKNGTLFIYPQKELITISFTFAGRQFQLQPQDFSLGEVQSVEKNEQGKMMCSSITKTEKEWKLGDNMWVLGGIFLDNLVTIFDFHKDRIGFATIVEAEREKGNVKRCAHHDAVDL